MARAADLEEQLVALYAEKELLFAELGVADAERIVLMIRSMEAQLVALYAEREAEWRSRTSPGASSSGAPSPTSSPGRGAAKR